MNSKDEKTKLEKDQLELLEAEAGTVKHFFGSWEKIFEKVSDCREKSLITYPLSSLLFTGVLMYLLRLGSRRQINFELRENENVEEKYLSLSGVDEVPHGDTVNYAFQELDVDEIQEVLCSLVDRLIRKKVLDRWRLLGKYFRIAIDGTGELRFDKRHCEHCSIRVEKRCTIIP